MFIENIDHAESVVKIALVSSHGGHLTETLELLEAFEDHEFFFVTYHSVRDADVMEIAPAYFTNNIGTNVFRMLRAFFWTFRVLRLERPDVVLSLGAEIAIPFFYWAKILRMRRIYIESFCRVNNLSRTGKLVYPIVDVFMVQWPQLLKACGPKAVYEGAVI